VDAISSVAISSRPAGGGDGKLIDIIFVLKANRRPSGRNINRITALGGELLGARSIERGTFERGTGGIKNAE